MTNWISTPHLRPDHRGPTDRPYQPFGDPATAPPMLVTLRAIAQGYDATAVEDSMGAMSYAELVAAVANLAAAIAAAPSKGGIGISVPNNRHYAVAVFACLAARRLSVLLDASFPEARNAAIAAVTGIDLVITTAENVQSFNWPGVAFLAADAVEGSAPLPASHLDPDAPALILSTSGSSGLPKPIVHSQRTMLHWARTIHDALHITPADRVLSLSSLSSLGGITGLLGYLLVGAATQLLELKAAGLGGLIATLKSRPVTVLRAAPSLLRSLAALPDSGVLFAGLRIIQTYGEPLMRSDVALFRTVIPADCRIRSTYGTTEASGLSWFADVVDDYDPARIPAGTLMPDTEAAIIDADGADCPPGSAGELVIRSRYNALGEWLDGRLQPGRLVVDSAEPNVRIFATGDVASCTADGVFVVLGRKDRMLNINGQRVEPAEIERAIEQVPGVNRAEVVVAKRGTGDTMIAFVVPQAWPARVALAADCRSHVGVSLPAYMMPSRIVCVDSIPVLPSGKTDQLALLAIAANS